MSTIKRTPWIAAAILAATLTATVVAAQKSPSPDVLYQRAVQKEMVDGDTKAAIDLYKQVLAAPGCRFSCFELELTETGTASSRI
jgi:hypothetical protein